MHLRKKASVETIFIRKTKNGKMENKSLHVILVKLETSLLRTRICNVCTYVCKILYVTVQGGMGFGAGICFRKTSPKFLAALVNTLHSQQARL